MNPEGTYLMWLDFTAYISDDQELENTLVRKGKVVLNPGITFGPSGHGHMRLNIACPEETLLEGLNRNQARFRNNRLNHLFKIKGRDLTRFRPFSIITPYHTKLF